MILKQSLPDLREYYWLWKYKILFPSSHYPAFSYSWSQLFFTQKMILWENFGFTLQSSNGCWVVNFSGSESRKRSSWNSVVSKFSNFIFEKPILLYLHLWYSVKNVYGSLMLKNELGIDVLIQFVKCSFLI